MIMKLQAELQINLLLFFSLLDKILILNQLSLKLACYFQTSVVIIYKIDYNICFNLKKNKRLTLLDFTTF